MAKFGGWSHFGGTCKFGGGEPHAQRAYRVLKSPPIAPPGLWPNDDDKLINRVLRAEAKGIGHGLCQLEVLGNEIFPQNSEDCLTDWELLLRVVPPPGASVAYRQAAVKARNRGDAGASLSQIRTLLYPLLASVTAFYDDFAHTTLNTRINTSGNGTQAVASSQCTLTLTSPADGDWLAELANLCWMRFNEIDDGWTVTIEITAATLGNDTAVGLVVAQDHDNAVMLVLGDTGGTERLRIDQVVDGTLTLDVDSKAVVVPALPVFLQISRTHATNTLTLKTGATLAGLTTFHTMDQPVTTLRKFGIFARNLAASTNTVTADFDSLRLTHATAKNNVEIVEQNLANVTASGGADLIFEAHVVRRVMDGGVEDGVGDLKALAQAQRICDSIKVGHTLLLVGQSDWFLCDSPYDLCDRDFLGE